MAIDPKLRRELTDFLIAIAPLCLDDKNNRKAVLLRAGLDSIFETLDRSGSTADFVPRRLIHLERHDRQTGQQSALYRFIYWLKFMPDGNTLALGGAIGIGFSP